MLKAWDHRAASTVYDCPLPVITTQPVSQTVPAGATVTLSVAATGAEHYAWFADGQPVGADAPVLVTGRLYRPTRFQVRVTNACGSVDSAVATVGVVFGKRRSTRK